MQRSTDRMLTSHTGSLPRPEMDCVCCSTTRARRTQADTGLSIINDGEHSKFSF